MKLAYLLSTDLIHLDIRSTERNDAFEELLAHVCSKRAELNHSAVLSAIMERESQQSTYLGHSLALPHARIDGLNDFIIACGRSSQGITYNGTNDKVHFIFMVLSCKTKINMLLQTMGALATLFNEMKTVEALMQAKTADDIVNIVKSTGISIKQTLVAKDIMREQIVTLTKSQTLKEVLDLFFTHNISGAPVLDDNGTVIGIVTEKELINIGLPKYMSMMDNISFLKEFEPFEEIFKKEDKILVKDILTTEYVFVHEDVAVIQLAFYFVNKSCRRILVIDDDKKLRGLIMRKDLIRKVIHA